MLRTSVTGLLSVLFVAPCVADVSQIVADRDNTLFESGDGSLSNGVGTHVYSGRVNFDENGWVERRALLHFDVSGIPANATIVSASVRVQVTKVPPAPPTGLEFGLHRCLADWGEAGSSTNGGDGDDAEPGDATWLHAFAPGVFWASPGGDFQPIASGTTIMNLTGSYTFSGAGLADDVQAWVSGGANHGWVMVGDVSTPRTVRKIASRENGTASYRPTLIVEWQPGGSPADLNSDGQVNGADLGLMLAAWGPCAGCDADLNGDGQVNGADLGLLLADWS
jgi:hypothetical protein